MRALGRAGAGAGAAAGMRALGGAGWAAGIRALGGAAGMRALGGAAGTRPLPGLEVACMRPLALACGAAGTAAGARPLARAGGIILALLGGGTPRPLVDVAAGALPDGLAGGPCRPLGRRGSAMKAPLFPCVPVVAFVFAAAAVCHPRIIPLYNVPPPRTEEACGFFYVETLRDLRKFRSHFPFSPDASGFICHFPLGCPERRANLRLERTVFVGLALNEKWKMNNGKWKINGSTAAARPPSNPGWPCPWPL
jgi:hypothetical protein